MWKKQFKKKRLISLSEKEKRVEECLPPTRLLKFDYQTCAIKSIFFNVIITVLCLQRVALKLCYLLTCFVKCADPDICKIHIFPMDTCTRQAAWKICLKPAYFNCEWEFCQFINLLHVIKLLNYNVNESYRMLAKHSCMVDLSVFYMAWFVCRCYLHWVY